MFTAVVSGRRHCRMFLYREKSCCPGGKGKNMSKVTVFDHPLITHKLTIMRQKETGSKDFRELLSEISMLMAYEITRDLPLEELEIETPICKTTQKMVSGKKIAIVPILRAGLGMVEGFLTICPVAKVGHMGVYRDPETKLPVRYYAKMPQDIAERKVVVLDPCLLTGGSSNAAISELKKLGCKEISL